MLGEVLTIRRANVGDTFAFKYQPMKNNPWNCMEVAQINNGFLNALATGEEIPAVNAMTTNLIPYQGILQDTLPNQVSRVMHNSDQNASRFALRQVASLDQDNNS